MFYSQKKSNMYDREMYDKKTILPLKYKEGPKAFDNDVESPGFTQLNYSLFHNKTTTQNNNNNTHTIYTPTPVKTNDIEILYCDNV